MQRSKFQGKIIFLILIIGFLSVSTNSQIKQIIAQESDYVDQFQLQQGATRLYVVNLTSNAHLFLNCTAYYKGIFYIYLFNERPLDNHILSNGSIDASITDMAVVYNETPSLVFSQSLNDTVHSVSLNYTAPSYRLYYIEIILFDNGPDTFRLESSYAMQAYYVPFIPGYNIDFISGCSIFAVFLLYFKVKKQKKI